MGVDVDLWIPITPGLNVPAVLDVVMKHRHDFSLDHDISEDGWVEISLLDRWFGGSGHHGDWSSQRLLLVELLPLAPGLRYGNDSAWSSESSEVVDEEFFRARDALWAERLKTMEKT